MKEKPASEIIRKRVFERLTTINQMEPIDAAFIWLEEILQYLDEIK